MMVTTTRDESAMVLEPIELSAGSRGPSGSGFPLWWNRPPVVAGRLLQDVGLQAPMLHPEQALLFGLVDDATDSGGR